MAIRRTITAVAVSLVIALALTIPLLGLVELHMLPAQGLLFITAGLLAVSWGWCGDWQLDHPSARHWVRLGLLLTAMFGVVISSFTGYRAWSIPDVGPIPPPALWSGTTPVPIPSEQNAAVLYSDAASRLIGYVRAPELLDRNRAVVELLRRTADRPRCQFDVPAKPTLVNPPALPRSASWHDCSRSMPTDARIAVTTPEPGTISKRSFKWRTMPPMARD